MNSGNAPTSGNGPASENSSTRGKVLAPDDGQDVKAKGAGQGSPRSRGCGSGSCETSSALASCLRSAGGTAQAGRAARSGGGCSTGTDGGASCAVSAGRRRAADVPFTLGCAVARCGTCTCTASGGATASLETGTTAGGYDCDTAGWEAGGVARCTDGHRARLGGGGGSCGDEAARHDAGGISAPGGAT